MRDDESTTGAFGELRSLLAGARPEDGARRFRDALYALRRRHGSEYVALRDQLLAGFSPPWPIPARGFTELEALVDLLPKEMLRSLVIRDRPLVVQWGWGSDVDGGFVDLLSFDIPEFPKLKQTREPPRPERPGA